MTLFQAIYFMLLPDVLHLSKGENVMKIKKPRAFLKKVKGATAKPKRIKTVPFPPRIPKPKLGGY